MHSKFRTALLDIAASLQLSRNILVAVLSFQSWKVFMQRWIRAQMGISTAFDNTNKPANSILKVKSFFYFHLIFNVVVNLYILAFELIRH